MGVTFQGGMGPVRWWLVPGSAGGVAGSGVSPGTQRGPHPGLDVLGPARVGQGVPGLLKGAARGADVRDHHGAAVPPQGVLDAGGWVREESLWSARLARFPYSLSLSLSHPGADQYMAPLSPDFPPPSPSPTSHFTCSPKFSFGKFQYPGQGLRPLLLTPHTEEPGKACWLLEA